MILHSTKPPTSVSEVSKGKKEAVILTSNYPHNSMKTMTFANLHLLKTMAIAAVDVASATDDLALMERNINIAYACLARMFEISEGQS